METNFSTRFEPGLCTAHAAINTDMTTHSVRPVEAFRSSGVRTPSATTDVSIDYPGLERWPWDLGESEWNMLGWSRYEPSCERPKDITKLGRGKAQKFILSTLHAIQGGEQAQALTDLARGYRGHFAGLMSGALALAKKGIITITHDNHHGEIYTLAPHRHG